MQIYTESDRYLRGRHPLTANLLWGLRLKQSFFILFFGFNKQLSPKPFYVRGMMSHGDYTSKKGKEDCAYDICLGIIQAFTWWN